MGPLTPQRGSSIDQALGLQRWFCTKERHQASSGGSCILSRSPISFFQARPSPSSSKLPHSLIFALVSCWSPHFQRPSPSFPLQSSSSSLPYLLVSIARAQAFILFFPSPFTHLHPPPLIPTITTWKGSLLNHVLTQTFLFSFF